MAAKIEEGCAGCKGCEYLMVGKWAPWCAFAGVPCAFVPEERCTWRTSDERIQADSP